MSSYNIICKRVALYKIGGKFSNLVNIILAKLNLTLPSREEALEILGDYLSKETSLEKIYKSIPFFINIFTSNKKTGKLVIVPNELVGVLVVILALASIFPKDFPGSASSAKARINELPVRDFVKLKRKSFRYPYLGTLVIKNNSKLLKDSNNLFELKNNIHKLLMQGNLSNNAFKYEGLVPSDNFHFSIYKDQLGNKPVLSLNDLKNYKGSIHFSE